MYTKVVESVQVGNIVHEESPWRKYLFFHNQVAQVKCFVYMCKLLFK